MRYIDNFIILYIMYQARVEIAFIFTLNAYY